jgi:hypothetical protein
MSFRLAELYLIGSLTRNALSSIFGKGEVTEGT